LVILLSPVSPLFFPCFHLTYVFVYFRLCIPHSWCYIVNIVKNHVCVTQKTCLSHGFVDNNQINVNFPTIFFSFFFLELLKCWYWIAILYIYIIMVGRHWCHASRERC
jgi:hypothetical protein